MTESVFLSCTIDVLERQDVATCVIPGMFIQTKAKPRSMYVMLLGVMLEIMLSLAPELKEFVKAVRGKRVLFIECNKTLYGSLPSGKLSYLKLCELLLDNRFVPDLY